MHWHARLCVATVGSTCYVLIMTESSQPLRGSLGEILNYLHPRISSMPRRVPGEMILEGRPFRYVDLHSFYHQVVQIFGQKLYDFTAESDAPVIFDCGAHIGLATLALKQRYPKAHLTAFEADPAISDVLRFNLNSFGLSDVVVRQQAVWVHDKGVIFEASHDDSGKVQGTNAIPGTTTTAVPSVRLRALLEQAHVDFVKLDIEGAEFSVIPDCFDVLRKARCYLVEAHVFDYPQRLGNLLSIFEGHGFRYVLGDLHQATWMPVDGAQPPFTQCPSDKFIVSIFAWRV